jgi:hypothetical protein
VKQLVANALVSVISGFCFALGVLAVVMLADVFDDPAAAFAPRTEIVRLPPEIAIAEHDRVAGTPYFTIRGVIENTGGNEWSDVMVKATILAGGAQVNDCDTRLDGKLQPMSRRAFQIECYGVAGTAVADALTYDLIIGSAYQEVK